MPPASLFFNTLRDVKMRRVFFQRKNKFGDDGKKDTPVPISNTEVKLLSADGTWRAASWESKTSPICFPR